MYLRLECLNLDSFRDGAEKYYRVEEYGLYKVGQIITLYNEYYEMNFEISHIHSFIDRVALRLIRK